MPTTSPLNPAIICPAVATAIGPVLAAQFPAVTLVGVDWFTEHNQTHVYIAVENTACGNLTEQPTPDALRALPYISLETCADISRAIDDAVDALPELAQVAYHLDVGSPGAFRQLTTAHELAFYSHWPVTLTPSKKSGNKAKPINGHLSTSATLVNADGTEHPLALDDLDAGTMVLALNPTLPKAT